MATIDQLTHGHQLTASKLLGASLKNGARMQENAYGKFTTIRSPSNVIRRYSLCM